VEDPRDADSGRRRLLIIGLDGVTPGFLFDRFLPVMPNVRRLLEHGLHGALRTTDPPISVPAWPVMFTGVDPGTLGLYGFRHRRPGTYGDMYIPTSRNLPVPTFWQILSDRGRRVAVIGMPLGYPAPVVNGLYISDFLTPPDSDETTYPSSLAEELEREFGPYQFDVVFRSKERTQLAEDLVAMTKQRFQIAAALYAREPWDVFAVHEIGTDRLNHAYWKHFDPSHPAFVAGNPYEHLAERYYALLDQGIGELVALSDDRTDIVIVSDHGAMAMRGCFCINQWLEERGYLVLRHPAKEPGIPIEQMDVDWKRTTAWGAGGYYARIFFNVRGREPEGTVALTDTPRLRARIQADLAKLHDADGAPIPTRVLDPREIYATVRGEAPDLIVYFDELKLRAAGTMGHPGLILTENDTGPDDAVHSFDGVFVVSRPSLETAQVLPELAIRDVTPILLEMLGEPIPAHIQGRADRRVIDSLRPKIAMDASPVPGAPEGLVR
jgi:predicted AlkP superfamily phosphohydrolase/phosphomutase